MSDCWAVVPAAGRGERFGGPLPKQYAPLAGRTVIEWALVPLLENDRIRRVVVALAPDDDRWAGLALSRHDRVRTVIGASARSGSVRNALQALSDEADAGDWVLVHDAARPCLSGTDLARVMAAASSDDVGAILALRVVDTLKREDGKGRIAETVAREGLWRALTPQVFRLGELADALQRVAKGGMVTDEAGAMELAGRRPLLVPGEPTNVKITDTKDLALAERLLER